MSLFEEAAGQLQRTPGRVHYTTIEEIPEGETITVGMFRVNQHLALVLFDSIALHSFIRQTFAPEKNQ
jgi:hypothetical protein